MGTTFEGTLNGAGLKLAIVVARFNALVTERLLQGAREALHRHGVAEEGVDVVHVPGAFEIPLAAKTLAQSGRYHAVICLGAVIRGATPHFEYVASSVASGIAQAALETHRPILFGVLTTESLEQALERAGAKAGNKGYDAAVAAIEMARLMSTLDAEGANP